MKRILLSLFLLNILLNFSSAQKVFKVPSEYANIQAAIDAAWDGDTVLVADGKYSGEGNNSIRYFGKRITLKSENGPDSCYVYGKIYFNGQEDTLSVLSGIRIYGNNAMEISSRSTPVIHNCIIESSATHEGKSAIECNGGGGYFLDCSFLNNYSSSKYSDAGAIVKSGSVPMYFVNCKFIGNGAGQGPGAIAGNNLIILNCTFENNVSRYYSANAIAGSNIYIENSVFKNNEGNRRRAKGAIIGSNYTIVNSIFDGNKAISVYYGETSGGSIATISDSRIISCIFTNNQSYNPTIVGARVEIERCTFYNNKALNEACLQGCNVLNSILYRNLPIEALNSTINYSLVRRGYAGEGNFDADPLFVNPDSLDFRLQPNSPCIDAGDPNSPKDPDGTRADIGAIPFNQTGIERIVVSFSADPESGKFPLTVQFTNSSTSNNTTITNWFWDFGDGNNSTEQNPQHTYQNIGKYPVQLIVTNGNLADTLLKEDYINVRDTTAGDIPTEGLVAYYPFNGNANDESGNGHHGNPASSTDFSGIDRFGNPNKAMYSGNSSSYITIPHHSQLDLQSHTIAAWVNVDGYLDNGGIFGNGYNIDHYALTAHETRVATWINYPSSPNDFRGYKTSILGDKEYHHVVASYDLNSRKIWIDGILVDEMAFSETIDYSTPEDCYIGMNFPGGDEWFWGSIDEILVYNRALSKEEIEALYNYEGNITSNPEIRYSNITTRAYPNPTRNTVQVQSNDEIQSVTVFSFDGKVICKYTDINNEEFLINLKEFNVDRGLYLFNIQTKSSSSSIKVIYQ